MRALLTGNVRNGLAGFRIDHHRVSAPGNVQPMRLWIDRQIVPSAFAANGKSLGHSPIRLRNNRERACKQNEGRDYNK